MAKANQKLSRFAKRHYEAIAEAMQEARTIAQSVGLFFSWRIIDDRSRVDHCKVFRKRSCKAGAAKPRDKASAC